MSNEHVEIERVRNGLREEFAVGIETNKGLDQKTRKHRFFSRNINVEECAKRWDVPASHIDGILDLLKQEGFISGYSLESYIPIPSATNEVRYYTTVIHYPLSFGKEKVEDDLFAWISFDSISRKIMYKDKWLLSRPRFNSPNHLFFEFVYQNPNRKLDTSEIKDYVKNYKTPNQTLSDLKFVGSFREMFFPGATVDGVYFKNPISKRDFEGLNISTRDLKVDLQRLKKERK